MRKKILYSLLCICIAASTFGQADNLGNHIATQTIQAGTNNTFDLGTSSSYFKDIYFGGKLYIQSQQYLRATSIGSANASLFIGENAGVSNTGSANVALGYNALNANTTGGSNVAIGSRSMEINTSGQWNTSIGYHALLLNTSGSYNTATGLYALRSNTTGNYNVANGLTTLQANTTGYGNTAIGASTLSYNTTGSYNTGVGYTVLPANTTGQQNSAFGMQAANGNTTGNFNVAIGTYALASNVSGSNNTAVGYDAYGAGNYDNSTAIGNSSAITASNQVRIGNSSVTSIGGQVSWTTLSDGRFKKSVKQDVAGLDFILKLRPISYIVDRKAVDNFLGIPLEKQAKQRPADERQTGFVAQEVEAIVKKSSYAFYGVESPKSDKDHYSIRYAEFVVPLVKAVQELDQKVNTQQSLIEEQKQIIEKQQEMLTVLLARNQDLSSEITDGSVLHQNHPNPFTGETEITMDIGMNVKEAIVNVHDLSGKTLEHVVVTSRGQRISTRIGSSKLISGIYLYSLVVDGRIVGTQKMVVSK